VDCWTDTLADSNLGQPSPNSISRSCGCGWFEALIEKVWTILGEGRREVELKLWRASLSSHASGSRHEWIGGSPLREVEVLAGKALSPLLWLCIVSYLSSLYLVNKYNVSSV